MQTPINLNKILMILVLYQLLPILKKSKETQVMILANRRKKQKILNTLRIKKFWMLTKFIKNLEIENNLSHDAFYPPSRKFHFYIVGLLIVCEIIFNGFFFNEKLQQEACWEGLVFQYLYLC